MEEPPPSTEPLQRQFDLAERTAKFGEAVIRFAKKIPDSVVTSPLIKQLVRSGTSIGANYIEADDAGSWKAFRYRLGICLRESRETQHWLRMLAVASPDCAEKARELWREAKELCRIFASILRRTKS
ncbi:MAG: four helix bundle protein [Planctomycetia bacterium]|nr:four helix bundle protein [Planctomycetia bacterium]